MDSLSFDVLVFVVWPLGDSKIYFGMFHKDVSCPTSFMASFMTSCNVSALSCESSNLLCFTIAECQQSRPARIIGDLVKARGSLLAMKFDGLSIPHTCDHNSFICSFVFAERPVMYTKRSPWGQSMLPHQLMLRAGGVSSPGLQDFSSELRLAIQGTSVSLMPNY
ncbi:hypothetical protein RDI58_022327 [Solanum bulbocastanum]|uniref:Uncharacterized protein n=1 Tax=Solanum bulbocastanum TaxID=147425 RepID=A0AAN8T943_SOLBU